jgi:hypothetical protein
MKDTGSVGRFRINDDGTEMVLFEDDSVKPYILRQPAGLPLASIRRFSRGKPRYRRYRGVLVMGRCKTK